jgi:hypothetical protein
VTQFCDSVAWLENGRLRRLGPTQEVVDAYEAFLLQREKRRLGEGVQTDAPALGIEGSVGVRVGRISAVRLIDHEGRELETLGPSMPLNIEIRAESARVEEPYQLGVAIDSLDGRCVLGLSTAWDDERPLSGRTEYRMVLRVPSLPVAQGTFHVSVFLLDDTGLHVHDQVILLEGLKVCSQSWTPSLLDVRHSWEREEDPG